MENSLVVKHNKLIEARYDLNLNEQKIILYAASKLDRNKKKFNIISLNIRDFFELLGTTQERYTEIKEIVRGLRKKEVIINTDERELITGWLSSIDYLRDIGIVELEFSDKLIPYLLQLKEQFTRYELKNILYLKNKHSIRVYELIKQYENIGKRKFNLEEFKKLLTIEGQYNRIYDLERFVLEPAVNEINKYTDIIVNYEKVKTGRKITHILFKIESKDEDGKMFIEFLNEFYNIEDMKLKMGLSEENFNNKQVVDVYELACQKTQDKFDVFEYVRLNYLAIKDKARNKYSYLMKAIENDYAKAAAQLNLLNQYI